MKLVAACLSLLLEICCPTYSEKITDEISNLKRSMEELRGVQNDNRRMIDKLGAENAVLKKELKELKETIQSDLHSKSFSDELLNDDDQRGHSRNGEQDMIKKIDSRIEDMKNSLNMLMKAYQSGQSEPVSRHTDLATGLENVRQDVSAIYLLEEERAPQLGKVISHYDEDINRLRNLTRNLDQELLLMQKSNQWNCNHSCSQTERRLARLEQMSSEFKTIFGNRESYVPPNKQDIENFVLQIISKYSGDSRSQSWIWEQEIEDIDGSGDSSDRQEIPSLLQGDDPIKNVQEQVLNLTFRVANSETETIERLETKADRVQLESIVSFCREEFLRVSKSLSKLEQTVKFNEDIARVYQEKIRSIAQASAGQAERALMISKVIQKVHSNHFGEIQNIKKSINHMETDVLRFGLKLTTLQADFLNSSLHLFQGSRKDHEQDMTIARLLVNLGSMEKNLDSVSTDVKNTKENIHDFVTYEDWKTTQQYLEVIHQKLSENFKTFHKANITLGNIKTAVNRLETTIPTDCSRSLPLVSKLSKRLIKPPSMKSLISLCGPDGWTIIQRRNQGIPNFNQSWEAYSNGFGDIDGDFWAGNKVLHTLTSHAKFQLSVETWDIFEDYRYLEFKEFQIGPKENGYAIQLGPIRHGNLTDSFSPFHNGMQFSTYDEDHDASNTHCAKYYGGGWWYAHCQKVNLNGNFHIGMTWFDNSTGDWIQLKRTSLKIRPATYL